MSSRTGMEYVLINTYKTQKPKETLTCLESSSLQRAYKVINFLATRRASIKPPATNVISEISSMSGMTMAQGLRKKTNPIIQVHRLVFKHGKNKSLKWLVSANIFKNRARESHN